MRAPVKVDVAFKRFFYDREMVRKKLGRKRLKAVRKAGLTVRKAARRRLRKRKRVSRPGESPSVHTEDKFATLKNILSGFDPLAEASVVGPVKFGRHADAIPGALEHSAHVARPNPRRRLRAIGDVGEIDIEPTSKTSKRLTSVQIVSWDKRDWIVTFAKLETPEQVRRANEINERLYGPAEIIGTLEARPFMEPAVESVKDQFVDLYVKEG